MAEIARILRRFVRSGELATDEDTRAFFASDIFHRGALPAAALRPRSIGAMCDAVGIAVDHGYAIIPRGGGLSYSAGYVTTREGALLIDTAALDAIETIDAANARVTVQAGCTWAGLQDRLGPLGLRPRFWGTASGLHSTVGGTLSQQAALYGSGRGGAAGDHLAGLSLVTAQGALLDVPGEACTDPGMFVGDCGALGIKARLVLPLEPVPSHTAFGLVRFSSRETALAATAAVAGEGLASESFLFDRWASDQRGRQAPPEPWIEPVPGQRHRRGAHFELHAAFEGDGEGAVRDSCRRFFAIGRQRGGKPSEGGVLAALRAHPFAPPALLVGPDGRRWVPAHFIVRHDALPGLIEAIEGCAKAHAESIAAHGICWGWSAMPIGRRDVLLEPSFYWRDAHPPQVRAVLPAGALARPPDHAADPAARGAVAVLRKAMIDAAFPLGARHMQLGRLYSPDAAYTRWSIADLRALKQRLDPGGQMNPGVLGLP